MSDSGKTYSALLIAQAIARARGGIVAAIDTEGRMKKYRDSRSTPSCTRSRPCGGRRRSRATGPSARARPPSRRAPRASSSTRRRTSGRARAACSSRRRRTCAKDGRRRLQEARAHEHAGVGEGEGATSALALVPARPVRADHPLPPGAAEDQDGQVGRQDGDRRRRDSSRSATRASSTT